jgi:hypothetical protein
MIPIIECEKCHTPYKLALAFVAPDWDEQYVWMPECRHKTADAVVRHNRQGEPWLVPGPNDR